MQQVNNILVYSSNVSESLDSSLGSEEKEKSKLRRGKGVAG